MTENAETPELCYICAEEIAPEDRDMDHIPPKSLFNTEDRDDLITLPTHRVCNQSFAKDDEYSAYRSRRELPTIREPRSSGATPSLVPDP